MPCFSFASMSSITGSRSATLSTFLRCIECLPLSQRQTHRVATVKQPYRPSACVDALLYADAGGVDLDHARRRPHADGGEAGDNCCVHRCKEAFSDAPQPAAHTTPSALTISGFANVFEVLLDRKENRKRTLRYRNDMFVTRRQNKIEAHSETSFIVVFNLQTVANDAPTNRPWSRRYPEVPPSHSFKGTHDFGRRAAVRRQTH